MDYRWEMEASTRSGKNVYFKQKCKLLILIKKLIKDWKTADTDTVTDKQEVHKQNPRN